MENSQLLIITFESFQKLTILKKEEILELALEHIMKKQQELYPILTHIRNYYQIVQIFNVLKHKCYSMQNYYQILASKNK